MIRKENYGLFVETEKTFEEAAQAIRDSAKTEGFGILWEIDVRKTMKDKLGVDMLGYIMFGACNPPIAYKALTTEPDIGLLLPCNFIAREENGKVVLGGVLPEAIFSLTKRTDMKEMTDKVEKMIGNVLLNAK